MTRLLAVLFAFLVLSLGAAAQTPPAVTGDSKEAVACNRLPSRSFERVPDAPAWITSAVPVTPTQGAPYCEVIVHVAQQVGIEMRLPLNGWNGKFWMNGNHGLGGQFVITETAVPLAMGYAVAAGDMGHHSRTTEAGWAYNSLQGKIDFGYRATHVAAVAAKAITAAFYGRPIAHAYFGGFSTGGRQALMEAERYPGDFEGIIAGPSPIWASEMHATSTWWTEIANHDRAGRPILRVDKVQLLHEAVTKACDGGDGVHDGLIADPRTCHWDPKSLQCPGNLAAANCLTRAQVEVVRKFYAAPHDSQGHVLYPGGLMRGSEITWQARLPYGSSPISHSADIGTGFLRYLAFAKDAGPQYDPMTFNFDRDPQRLATYARLYDATNPDLRPFRARGGKLIMFSGWADEAMAPLATVKFYEEIVRATGGQQAARSFVRLFMIPGEFHDPEGVGPVLATTDFLPSLEAWVEGRKAPVRVVAKEVHDGLVARTRPVFPYPLIAHYSGSGDPNDAANFVSVTPAIR